MAIERKRKISESSRLFAKNLPESYSEQQVRHLFSKHGTVTDCRLLTHNGKSRRIAYIGYKSVLEAQTALKKLNGTTIGISKLSVERSKAMKDLVNEKPKKKKKKEFLSDKVDPSLVDSDDEENNGEDDKIKKIADSGRLFVRNLSYLVTETDLKTTFEEYGTLSELVVPLDEETEKSKGFAFVEFQSPEDAVKALNGLDGSIFMGRLLHILPGEERTIKKPTAPIKREGNTSYKKEKLAKMRETATTDSSSWNSLFVGSSAVADQMAKKYDTAKVDIMKRDDAAVQLALGEAQIVNDIKEYLTNHGKVVLS